MLNTIRVRPFLLSDAAPLAAAFAAIGWAKPASLFEGYLAEEEATRKAWLAEFNGERAGYVTLRWQSSYPPLSDRDIPEVEDLNVLPDFRRRGIASRLMDEVEVTASTRADEVGLAVGLHPGYNAAQRLYALRGYVPDGLGVTHRGLPIAEGALVPFDDDLVLHLTKRLR